jgi:hypothetical protein
VEIQQLQLHRIQFRWDADTYSDAFWNSDPDTFERFRVAFSRTEQHSNGRRCDVHYLDRDPGIDCHHGNLCNGRDGQRGLELLAKWDTGSGHDSARRQLSYGDIDRVERG